MRRVLIASHHHFAQGLRDVLEFVLGPQDIAVVSAYVDSARPADQIAEALSRVGADDEVLVLTDILEGSVNQLLQPYASDRVHLVSGVNVPCALELVSAAEPLGPEIIRQAIARARAGLVYVNELSVPIDAEDE